MGPQQILFLILGVCIVGIMVSYGFIFVQSNVDSRMTLQAELVKMAEQARQYYARPLEEDGGDGSFIGLTCTPQGIRKLTRTPSTPFAQFSIPKSGNTKCVQILAVGSSPGSDPRKPVKLLMTVFPDSFVIADRN